MIGHDGKPLSRDQVRDAIAVYNTSTRGSKDFARVPRALVTILDGLTIGKTTYVKAADGQLQLSRRKDKTIVVA